MSILKNLYYQIALLMQKNISPPTLLCLSVNKTTQALAQLLKEQPIHITYFQPYRIEQEPWDTKKIPWQSVDKIIITSPNAVAFGLKNIIGRIHPHTQIYAIGANTAQQAQKLTPQKIIYPKNFSSEDLLKLPGLQTVKNAWIVLFKGYEGRHLIADTLQAHGAIVYTICCYKRTDAFLDLTNLTEIWQNKQVRYCLVSSIEIFDRFRQVLTTRSEQDQLTPLTFIATSARIASHLRKLGFRHLALAKNYSVEAILQCLKDLGISHDNTG